MGNRDDRYRQQALRSVAVVGYLGSAIAIPIAAGMWLGYLVDQRLGNSGAFTVLGVVLGLASGGVSAYKIVMQALAEGTTGARNEGQNDNDRRQP